ncbi:hypothetical protein Gotri_008628 [Gossypium trilobum]|uniref:Peptidase metallopeptidase domain-containing protein n=1 Tax=Gossypium trilobum TaxID=34281 RepID=A0A7J9EKI4_9ROSI|nr:hypothetical protein [Gossypium trilobum]
MFPLFGNCSFLFFLFFFCFLPRLCFPTEITSGQATVITTDDHNATWHNFTRFKDAEKGSHVSGIAELKKYFQRFGYLSIPDNQNDNFTDVLDAQFESAVVLYQQKFGLSITGKLDSETISTIMSSRCGVSDTDNYPLANIRIGFFKGNHGDGQPFDGVLGVLAHAFSPENGRFHLDKDETWVVDFEKVKSKVAVDLESVVTHEIGHILGLAHCSVKEAVMYPSLKPRSKKVNLKLDDVEGVQALYGSNPNFKFNSLLDSENFYNKTISLNPRSCSWTFSSAMVVIFLLLMIT